YIFITAYNTFPMLKFFFENLLRIEGVEGSSVIMLSLAYSVGMFLNLFLLWYAFRKDFSFKAGYGIMRTILESFVTSTLMGSVAYTLLQFIDPYFSHNTSMGFLLL